MGLTTPHHKNKLVAKQFTEPQTWTHTFHERPKQQKMGMTVGTWKVNLYRVGSLMTLLRELTKHKLDVVGMQ